MTEISQEKTVWPPDSTTATTIKMMADNGASASEVATAIGLETERQYLLYQFAKREGFRFTNTARRRSKHTLHMRLEEDAADLLDQDAARRGMSRRHLGAKLLGIVLRQGPTFIDNLLDD